MGGDSQTSNLSTLIRPLCRTRTTNKQYLSVAIVLISHLFNLQQRIAFVNDDWLWCSSLQPVYSNGVTITPDAPRSTGITSTSLTDTHLTFTWSRFTDPSISARSATAISRGRHEWTLLVDHGDDQSPEHLFPWRLMEVVDIHCNQTSSTDEVRIVHKQWCNSIN